MSALKKTPVKDKALRKKVETDLKLRRTQFSEDSCTESVKDCRRN